MRVNPQQPNPAALQFAQSRGQKTGQPASADAAKADDPKARGIYTTTSFASVAAPSRADRTDQAHPVRADRTGEAPAPPAGDLRGGDGALTLEGLKRAWGQSDSPYDLNGDKTVNVDDLVKFINNWPDTQRPGSVSPNGATADDLTRPTDALPAAPPADGNNELTLEGLREAWGQSDTPYDLNDDGTVNVDDLIAFLRDRSTPAEGQGGAADGQNELTLEGLREAWGQSDTPYDLNDDGTVNVDDLIAFLRDRSTPAEGQGGAADGQNELTLEGLREAWGQSDTPYDLNNDGTVNVDDLIAFLQSRSTPGAVGGGAADGQNALTLEGLREAWGQSDTPYDLNNDGTVNVDDLIAFLQSRSEPGATGGDQVGGAGQLPGDGGAGLTLEGLRAAWGQTGSPYDLNGDETVNVDDLVRFIVGNGEAGGAAQANVNEAQDHGRRVGHLADLLIDRLQQAGFSTQAPVDLHDILDSLGLEGPDRQDVTQRLSQAFPDGLGVNVRA